MTNENLRTLFKLLHEADNNFDEAFKKSDDAVDNLNLAAISILVKNLNQKLDAKFALELDSLLDD